MKVIIQKPDLDTCLAALILGITEEDDVVVCRAEAPPDDLRNPGVLCIEAGGSGDIGNNNFDHHDACRHLPPACRQAYEQEVVGKGREGEDTHLEMLVKYVCMVDERPVEHPPIEFPSLSNVFSGMMLVEQGPLRRFRCGLDMLRKVLSDGLDPFGTMPDTDEWRPYVEAKRENYARTEAELEKAEFHTAAGGRRVGFLRSEAVGGAGALYAQGCDVAVLCNPAFGDPPVRKYTVAGNGVRVGHLIGHFNEIENGWGGRETIIGSPRTGSALDTEKVIEIVLRYV